MEKDRIVEDIRKISSSTFRECLKRLFYKYSILKNDEDVFHYTNIDAVINGIIVENPEKDKEILLKATRWTHLNDKNELKSGLELIGGESERLSFLSDGLKQYHKKTCLLSFCRNADSLPMWNMYGKNGNGVMLAFDTKVLREMYGYRLLPCIYEDTEYDVEVIKRLGSLDLGEKFKSLSNEAQLYISFVLSALFVSLRKNRAFEYEDEFRIIGIGNKFFEDETPTLYRTAKDIIVPYTNVFFPKNALKGVWMGPTNNEDLSVSTMKEFLESKGFDIPVEKSKIPYRG